MMQKQIPTYYGFRVYLTSNLLYSFLVIPFLIFIVGQNIPEIAKKKGFMNNNVAVLGDSLVLNNNCGFANLEEPKLVMNTPPK